jgi:hypothetical protein
MVGEGQRNANGYAFDVNGNRSEHAGSIVMIDTVAPTGEIADPGPVRQGAKVLPAVTCADATSGVAACRIDEGLGPDGFVDTETPGDRWLVSRVRDRAGNETVVRRLVQVTAYTYPASTTTLSVAATATSRQQLSARVAVTGEAVSGGTLVVRDGSRVIATWQPPASLASFTMASTLTLPRLAPGTHRLTAAWSGAGSEPSTSAVRTVAVKSPVSVSGSYSVSRRTAGRAVVKVRGWDARATGIVRVYDRTRYLGWGRVSSTGTAVVRLPRLSRGTHLLRARYLGSSLVLPGWSAYRTYRL